MQQRNAIRLLVPLLLIGLWEFAVRQELVVPSQSAAPSAVITRLWTILLNGTLLRHTGYSLARLTLGVSIGALLGVVVGILLGSRQRGDNLFTPTLQFLAGVPVVLWMPFCVMFFGTEEAYKVSLVAIGTFFLLAVLTLHAVRLVEKRYYELAIIYRRTYLEQVREIYLPSAAATIFAALRTALVIAWVVLFFIEYASATAGSEGLGWYIADARSVGKIEEEFAGLFFLGVLAYTVDRAVAWWQQRVLQWTDALETPVVARAA